jgi:hypothetical protein
MAKSQASLDEKVDELLRALGAPGRRFGLRPKVNEDGKPYWEIGA